MNVRLLILVIVVASLMALSASADYSADQCNDSTVRVSENYPYTITYFYDRCTWTAGIHIESTHLYSPDDARDIALDFLHEFVGQEVEYDSREVCSEDTRKCRIVGIYKVNWVSVTLNDRGDKEYVYYVGDDLKLIHVINEKSTQTHYEESEFQIIHKPQQRDYYTTPTKAKPSQAYGDTAGCLFGEYKEDVYKYFYVEVMQGVFRNFYEIRLVGKDTIYLADLNLREFAEGLLKRVAHSRCDGRDVTFATISAEYNGVVTCVYRWNFYDDAMHWECYDP